MARVHGKDVSAITVGDSAGVSRDLTADTLALNFKVSADVHDTHTIGDQWKESTPGLKGGDTFDQELFYNNAAVASLGTYLIFFNRLGAASQVLSWTDGVRTTSMQTIIVSMDSPIPVGDMIKLKVTHKITGTVTVT